MGGPPERPPGERKVIPGLYTHSYYFYTSAWTSSAGSGSPIVDVANAVHLFYEMKPCKRVGAGSRGHGVVIVCVGLKE